MGNRLKRASWLGLALLAVVLGLVVLARRSQADADEDAAKAPKADSTKAEPAAQADEDEGMIDPMGPNSACYVCHMTFVFEELARTHLPEKVTCIKCHGLSAAHANDENIGATKPDITFKREEIDAACQKCHEEHDVSAQKVVARYLERELKDPKPVCTDCHGTHRIERAEEEEKKPEAKKPEAK